MIMILTSVIVVKSIFPNFQTETTKLTMVLSANITNAAPTRAENTATIIVMKKPPPQSVTPSTRSATTTPEVQSEDMVALRLKNVAQKYLADTPEQAALVARRINYLGGKSESADNMCGPLSAAILIDSGILNRDVEPHDLWLLNARDDGEGGGMHTLQRIVFPPQMFEYYRVEQSVVQFDWSTFPLKPGDWLYLFTTPNGFDHMLVVTEVKSGIPYTVTNWERADVGFQIIRTPLYDPDRPGEGLFYEMTNPNRGMMGMSGGKGFLLIRKKEGLTSPLPMSDLQSILDTRATWRGLIIQTDGELLFASRPNEKFHPASMIKLPLTMAFLDAVEENGITSQDLETHGYRDATFKQLVERVLVKSEEEAAETMLEYLYFHNVNSQVLLESWGLEDTTFSPRRTTAFDLVKSMQLLYQGDVLSDWSRSLILESLATYTSNDDTLLGQMKSVLPDAQWLNKRGTMVSPLTIGETGILVFNEQPFYVILQGTPKVNETITYEEMEAAVEGFAIASAEWIAAYAEKR